MAISTSPIPGVTPLADAASVRASLRESGNGPSVVSVRSALQVPAEPARASVSAERVQEIENQLERLRAEAGDRGSAAASG